MKLIKLFFKNILFILLCIFLFILYIILDRKYYNKESFELNPDFNIIGNPNDTEFGPLDYDNIANNIENSETYIDLSNAIPELREEFSYEDDFKTRFNTIKSKKNKRFFNIESIKKDFKYFNNAANLMHANNTNDTTFL